MEPRATEKATTLATATTLADVAHSVACKALGLNQATDLPDYFKFDVQYHKDQFTIGWTARNIIAGRVKAEEASFVSHPDAGQDFDKLDNGVKGFIKLFSVFQTALLGKLSTQDLLDLKQAGDKYTQALATGEQAIFVQDPLLTKVNHLHHTLWTAARDLARVLEPPITIRDHKAHKEISLMTPEEVAADNASVQGYGLILSKMPEEHFNWLLAKCQG